jgi:hypothetical protein
MNVSALNIHRPPMTQLKVRMFTSSESIWQIFITSYNWGERANVNQLMDMATAWCEANGQDPKYLGAVNKIYPKIKDWVTQVGNHHQSVYVPNDALMRHRRENPPEEIEDPTAIGLD